MTCDRRWEVDAYREGRLGEKDAQSFERHLRVCDGCRLQKASDERLRRLARSLPDPAPSDLTLRRLRARVLRDVATGAGASPRARMLWSRVATAAPIALAVGLGGAWVLRGRAAPPAAVSGTAATVAAAATPAPSATAVPAPAAFAGTVRAGEGARWTQAREAGIERVTLGDGTIDVHVRHQEGGERFLVAMPDGEIEVRGTTFDVTVSGGATARVHVDEGLVDLRLHGRAIARLGAGDTWAPAPIGPAPRTGAAQSAGAAVAVTGGRVSPTPGDQGAAEYGEAVRMLREGRSADAAGAFEAFLLAHPRAPQAEDASFLQAVALARAGRADAAALAAEQHLSRFPSSFHRKEAALLVARAASQRGDCERARAAVSPWPADADAQSALGACGN
jgi:anti-sigma factor RsiW